MDYVYFPRYGDKDGKRAKGILFSEGKLLQVSKDLRDKNKENNLMLPQIMIDKITP